MLAPQGGANWFLRWGEGRCVSQGPEVGWRRWFPPPSVLRAGGTGQYHAFACNTPLLCPGLQKWQLGFCSLCILSITGPTLAWMQPFLAPYHVSLFCCSRVQRHTLQQRARSCFYPMLSQLSSGKINVLNSGKEFILKITLLRVLFLIFLTFRYDFLNQFYF